MVKFIKIGIPFLIVAGLISVWLTGSLGETAIAQKDRAEAYLVAKEFYGLVGQLGFDALLDEVSELNRSGKLEGTFAVLYESSPDVAQDSMYIWVGAVQETGDLPRAEGDWQTIRLQPGDIVEATIHSTELFSPGPAEVNRRLAEFAETSGLVLDEQILELYQSDGKIRTQRQIRDSGK